MVFLECAEQFSIADTKRGKTCTSESLLGLVLLLIGLERGVVFLNQSLSVVKENQSKQKLLLG